MNIHKNEYVNVNLHFTHFNNGHPEPVNVLCYSEAACLSDVKVLIYYVL